MPRKLISYGPYGFTVTIPQQFATAQTVEFSQPQTENTVVQDNIMATLKPDIRLPARLLRRSRNNPLVVSINCLPSELFHMVFGYLRHPPFARHAHHLTLLTAFASYKPLVSAMLVCHKWNEIISRAASLWTEIDSARYPNSAPVLLTRSLGAPIHLCGILAPEDSTLEKIIRDNCGRILELELLVCDPTSTLPSILAVDMPRTRVLCLSREEEAVPQPPALLAGYPASFHSLWALLLDGCLFVPSHVLPQLTHLLISQVKGIHVSNILNLLKNTPALEVLNIIYGDFIGPLDSTMVTSSIALPRLYNAEIYSSTFAAVRHLMTPLFVPNLKYLDLSTIVTGGMPLFMPFLPAPITTHTMRRLAFHFEDDFVGFHTTFHGSDFYLNIELHIKELQDADRTGWAFTYFPTMLPLSGIDELHFQASQWEAPHDLLPHLATHMPAATRLVLKHKARDDAGDVDGHMALARTVARVLESDGPVLFPALAHLELVVTYAPLAFCTRLARALARRERDGRRLRTLRIRTYQRWSDPESPGRRVIASWAVPPAPDYRQTGIFDHVESGEVCGEYERCEDGNVLGWGKWRDSVQPAEHDYWEQLRWG